MRQLTTVTVWELSNSTLYMYTVKPTFTVFWKQWTGTLKEENNKWKKL
jgi:hypothetical protein